MKKPIPAAFKAKQFKKKGIAPSKGVAVAPAVPKVAPAAPKAAPFAPRAFPLDMIHAGNAEKR